jgi:hypothetical protein
LRPGISEEETIAIAMGNSELDVGQPRHPASRVIAGAGEADDSSGHSDMYPYVRAVSCSFDGLRSVATFTEASFFIDGLAAVTPGFPSSSTIGVPAPMADAEVHRPHQR